LVSETQSIGKWGEIATSRALEYLGYMVLERNYRTFEGEVDIICRYNEEIIFIEVKTRRSNRFGVGEESVNRRKLLKLAKCGLDYLARWRVDTSNWRIEVVVIEGVGPHFYRFKLYQNLSLDGDEKLLDDAKLLL